MSSSQARNGIESWSLRRRLIFEQIVLLALVCVIIVLVTEIALRAFLIGQLDRRLEDAAGRARSAAEDALGGAPSVPPGPQLQMFRTDQAPGTLIAVIRNDTVQY